MKRGSLIVFTGIDGSGKTTQAELLVRDLQKNGIDVSYVWSRWEPFLLRPVIRRWKSKGKNNAETQSDNGDADFNELKSRKKKLLDNPVIRCLWLIFFFIDYGIQIFMKVSIELFKRDLIISDRIFYDSVIDQAINLGRRKDWLLDSLNSFWMKLIFPELDVVVYVDCPAEIAFPRKDDAPNVAYLTERRDLYLKLAARYAWITIDGTMPVNQIANVIKEKVYVELDALGIKVDKK